MESLVALTRVRLLKIKQLKKRNKNYGTHLANLKIFWQDKTEGACYLDSVTHCWISGKLVLITIQLFPFLCKYIMALLSSLFDEVRHKIATDSNSVIFTYVNTGIH